MTPAGKVIAVTGASRGIGAEIALELARRSFTVGCLTRSGRGLESAEADRHAGRLIYVACDITDENSVKAALAILVAQAGALNGLINNAGIHLDAPSHEMPTETYEKVMATNATRPMKRSNTTASNAPAFLSGVSFSR